MHLQMDGMVPVILRLIVHHVSILLKSHPRKQLSKAGVYTY